MKRIVLLAAAVVTIPLAAIPAAGQDPGDEPDLRLHVSEVPLAKVDRELRPSSADPTRQVSVIVELSGDPVAVEDADALENGTALTRGQESQVAQVLESAQDAVVPAIEKLGGHVRSQFQQAYNGMAVRLPAGQVEDLAALPGVVAVHSVEILKPTNAATNQLLQTPGVWGDLGFTGKDVKVGIIDSGIDYYHADFGGSGVAADYANDDRTVIEPGTFPTAKVVGGVDFVGDAFDPQSDDPELNTPDPDPDPLDCGGHGSQMAGTIAGQGVLVDRSTYTGPYDNSTLDNGFLIGPGVAPEAKLYALKVDGCNLAHGTSTDVILKALDWSVAHHLDVVNLSLGGALGRPDDASAVAATNAARAGVVVVAAAGNDGAGPYTLSAPASGEGALAVGAVDTFQGFDVVQARTPTDTVQLLNLKASPRIPVNGPLRVLTDDPSTPANESYGCAPSDYSAVRPGDIVAVRGGTCSIADLTTFATQAGAAAVIRINTLGGLFLAFGSQAGAIPILSANQEDEAKIVAADGSTVSIEDAGFAFNSDFGAIPSFSSSGPRNGDSGLKPDVVAPGLFIVSTGMGTGFGPSGVLDGIGTSSSTAFVSGMAALVREARPTWPATQVKAAIINNVVPLGAERRATSGGSGLPLPRLAVDAEVVAMGDRFGGGLSYGLVESPQPVAHTQKVTLVNHSDRAVTYTLRPEWSTDVAQPTMTFSQNPVTVPARERATVDVTLRVDPRLVPGGDNPGGLARQPAMVAGNVVLGTGQEGELGLRVPFSAVVRGTSSISTTPKAPKVADQVSFTSTNTDGVVGPIDVFAWGLSDPKGDALGTDVRSVGIQTRPDQDLGLFAIHSANTESNPSVNEWDVMLNTDSDEEPDYAIVGRDAGLSSGGPLTGTSLVAETVDLETGQPVSAFSAITQLNSGIVILPFRLSDVGLVSGEHEEFSYTAKVVSLEEGRGEDPVDGVARFNAFRPPVQTSQFNVAFPGSPAQWTATVDRGQLAETPVKGWLVVYRFNRGGSDQAQTITLR